jgi:hypothetical protein
MNTTPYPTLTKLDGFPFAVYASSGSVDRGRELAALVDASRQWLLASTGRPAPLPDLVVADEDDWPEVCEIPIYGMPFSIPGKLGASPTPGAWWQRYLDTVALHLDAGERSALRAVLHGPDSVRDLADLILVHETAHFFHQIDPVTWASEFPSDWVMELFANLAMYGYVASEQPDQLPLLTALVPATRKVPGQAWPFHELGLMTESMRADVLHYVWYEFRLIGLAQVLWDVGGPDVLARFHEALGRPELTPEEVVRRLDRLAPAVADEVRRWPEP